jgi:hypothetical protein
MAALPFIFISLSIVYIDYEPRMRLSASSTADGKINKEQPMA